MKNPIKLIATLLVAALASSTLFGNGQEGLASDGETLSGRIINLSIKPGATVTFNGVDVTCSVKDMVGGAVNCLGDATIILADGSKNTVVSEMACTSAIYVPTNHTLTIRGGGSLEAKATKDYCAAIGACSKWLGVNEDRGQCGNIVIAGGKVTAVAGGSYAAAIGAASYKGRCGDITICGNADVTAVAGYSAAAIGAAGNGGSCGDITIKDSASVKATAMAYPAKYNHERYGNNGAGIGGGNDSPCGNIVIATTGRIEAIGAAGRFGGAGIGAGGFSSDSHGCGDCGEIVISNGVIVATGRGEASGIGGSTGAGCGNIRILGGDITATGGTGSAGIGICSTNSAIIIAGGKVLATAGPFDGNLPYWAHTAVGIGASWEGHNIGSITISGGKVEAVGARCCPAIGKSYGGSCQSVTITDGIEEVIARKGSDSKEHIGSNSESKPCAVSIAKSLSQTYSEDKTTLILGHGGGTSGRGGTGGGTTQGGGGASSSGGGGTSSSGGGTTSQGGGSSSQGSGASGNWLCRMSFDDSANPLKAEGVADAFVRKGRKGTTERVSGMGDIKWTSAGGDGAVEIPKDWHIALPVPDKLAKEPGHPYSIEMRFRLSTLDDWQPLLNMPADNETDSLVYVNKVDSRLAIKQHNKASGTAVYGGSGFVVGKDHTLVVNFGADKTTAFLDGKQVFTRECTLAGSYADCSKAGGYFLIRGDEDGEGGTVTFYEVKVYDGAVGATPASKDNGGVGCFYPGSGHGGVLRQEPAVKMPDTKRAPDYLNPDGTPVGSEQKPSAEVQQTLTTFSEDNGLSAAEKIPALKAYIETHLDEPGIEKLIDLLEKLAKEANDAETLKWVEEIRKKLADRKSGGVTLEGPGKQGSTGGNQPTGTNPTLPAGEAPPNVNPADNGHPPATPTQTNPGNTPTTNPPAATNPAGGGDSGKKPTTTGGGGDEPQPGDGKKPDGDESIPPPPEDTSTEPRTITEKIEIPAGADVRQTEVGVWRLVSRNVEAYKDGEVWGRPAHYKIDGDKHTMEYDDATFESHVSELPKLIMEGRQAELTLYAKVTSGESGSTGLGSTLYGIGVGKDGKEIEKYKLLGVKKGVYGEAPWKFRMNGGASGEVTQYRIIFESRAGKFTWTYEYVIGKLIVKGGCWKMVKTELYCAASKPKVKKESETAYPNRAEAKLYTAGIGLHRYRWAYYTWFKHFDNGERLAAYCDFTCGCTQPPPVGYPDQEFKLTMNYTLSRDPNVGNVLRVGCVPAPIKVKRPDGGEFTARFPNRIKRYMGSEQDTADLRLSYQNDTTPFHFFHHTASYEPGTLSGGELLCVYSNPYMDNLIGTNERRKELAEDVFINTFPKFLAHKAQHRDLAITFVNRRNGQAKEWAITKWIYEWEDEEEQLVADDSDIAETETEEPEEEQQGEAAIRFAQDGMGLPANKDKFVLKSEDKKKNKVGLDEYRIPFAVLNMPTNREYTVTAGFRRMGAAGEDGRYLEADAVKEPIPYSVETVKDKKFGDKGLWEAVIKETGAYELPAGTSEGILLKVVAESGKKGDKDYVKVYETFPVYRIHLGLSFMLQANTIPCYLEMGEKSKYKLDKQDIAGDPEKDPDDKYVIRQEDFEVPLREGAMLLLLYDEDRADFIRIPAVPKATRVTATKVANDRYCQTRDAEENHQELVDRLGIKAISTGKTRANGSHVVKIGPTKGVLDPPLRLLADLEVDAVYSNRVSNFTRTFTAKKHVLLHSQPMRVFENSDDERECLDRDAHIRKRLERIRFKIEGTCINRLFSLRNMIDRMIDGYDSRFGYDERQVKSVMDTYVGFIEGRFMGANGVPYKVTFSDDLKACYAFMQGLRDNTGFLGRMAMGVLTGGVSEHVFTTMTVLENMQNEIMTCKDAKEFGFLAAFKIGAEEIGKQVLMEMIAQGAIQGAAKAANIDVNATMQMWAGRYRNAMDGADSWLKSKSGLYKAGDKALQSCKNFLGGGTKAAAKAVENVVRSEEEAAKRAEELLKKSRNEMSPAELKAVKQYEEAMENGLKKVRNLQKAQQAMEDAAKNNRPALKAAKEEYRRLADEVWSDKCALKKLQEVRGDYAKRMRAQFNNYRENLLDSVQREALGDIAKELGVPPDQLYLMNASNGVKTDYLTGKKVPGDRDISYMQKVLSDRTKDLTIDQSIGQRSVARRLWKKMHGGQEPPSIDEALKFMKGKDVTYVNPNGDAASYVFEHNLDGYEDLPGMVGMTKDGKINKNLLANDLHNPTINAASIKHKGVEWWGPTASDKLARAAEWEALAAKYQGSAKAKLLEKAFDLRCQAVGDVCEGIRQITKQTDNIIVPRGANRVLGHPMPAHLQDLHALAKRVGQDVSPAEFTKALQKYKLDLNTWADQVSKCLNAKNVPVPEINVPNFFTPKAINDALDREKKKNGRR